MSKLDLFAPHREQYNKDEEKHDGPQFWRSIEHKEKSEASQQLVDAEFPHTALAPAYEDDDKAGIDRRDMMKIMGATMALGAGTGCIRRPEEKIVPYTKAPEMVIPGIAQYYASALPSPYGAVGILVESHEGRPTKIEGNPDHPLSRGKIGVQGHSNMLELYDPDRSRAKQGANNVWKMWDAAWPTFTKKHIAAGGAGLAFLLDTDESPALSAQLKKVKAKYPSAKIYRYDALAPDNALLGAEMTFGAGTRVHTDLSKANVVLVLDGDVLNDGPEHLKHAADFAAGRSFEKIPSSKDAKKMNRMYVVESSFTVTGSTADNRMRVPSNQVGEFLKALANELKTMGVQVPTMNTAFKGSNAKFLKALAKDIANNKRKSVIMVGEKQPAAVHALANVVNEAIGALVGGTSVVTQSREPKTAHITGVAALTSLVKDIESGAVKTLVTIGTNPVYTAPKGLKVEEAFKKLPYSVHIGLYNDETARASKVHLPLAHSLESWGDTLAWDGTYSVVQPLIMPLHDGRSALEVIAQFAGTKTEPRSLVLGALAAKATKVLHDGVGSKMRDKVSGAIAGSSVANITTALGALKAFEGIELVIENSPKVMDGRRANLSWNQELPHPMSKLTWDNALLMSPKLARKLEVTSRIDQNNYSADIVTIKTEAGSVSVPVFVLPGIAENSVILNRGYGRTQGGYIATGIGIDSTPVTPNDGSWFTAATITRAGKSQTLVCTQDHFSVDGKPFQSVETLSTTKNEMSPKPFGRTETLARGATAAEFEKNANFAKDKAIPGNLIELKRLSKKGVERREMLKKANKPFRALSSDKDRPAAPAKGLQMVSIDPHKEAWTYDEFQSWGMTIDLTTCIGCNACTIACQSENNIPSVGRESVSFGRELHWIRVDRYFEGDVDEPKAKSQPVPCMHCENAPCEPVCPFAATVHDAEGLNAMVYNRCAGTRYCLNNCPYKVRRYNYFDFSKTAHLYVEAKEKERHEVLKLARNPNVSVRFRGVMEKCTYCTQRIQAAKFAAKRKSEDHRNLPDGAVTPACAQSCPTSAIAFGNINDPKSEVAIRKKASRNYEMLSELNIRPRTTYLAQLKNPNPELV